MNGRSLLETPTSRTTTGPRQLLLLGAGPTHRQLLARLAQHPVSGVQITLISPHQTVWQPERLAAFVAGRASAQACQIALEHWVQRSGVNWLCAKVRTLDASGHSLSLDDGSTRTFDCLSIDTEALQDRKQIEQSRPGAREHALFVTPLAGFAALWPQVGALAEQRALRFTVVGAGAVGTELALALQARFPSHSTTLLAGSTPPCAFYPLAVQERVLQTLKQRKITVLQDTALQISDKFVQLACGAALTSDVTVLATPARAPIWAQSSGLALCAQGLMAVDEHHRSTSHPRVFVLGDCSHRESATHGPRSYAGSAQSGADLAQRLVATLTEQPLPAARASPGSPPWSLLDLGHGQALASRGGWTVQGRWVGWIKTWLDQKHGV